MADRTFEYTKGVKVLEYRWSKIFTPDPELSRTVAFFEFDLSYISVPQSVFEDIKRFFEAEFPFKERECNRFVCTVIKNCTDTIAALTKVMTTSA